MRRASERFSRMTFRYGSHMAEQMKTIFEAISSPTRMRARATIWSVCTKRTVLNLA
jgi:hypothetical protein